MFLSVTYIVALVQLRHPIGSGAVGLLVALFGMGGMILILLIGQLTSRTPEVMRVRLGAGLVSAALATLQAGGSVVGRMVLGRFGPAMPFATSALIFAALGIIFHDRRRGGTT